MIKKDKMLRFALIVLLFAQCFAVELVEEMREEVEESELEHEFEILLNETNSQIDGRLDRMALTQVLHDLNEEVGRVTYVAILIDLFMILIKRNKKAQR